MQFFVCIEFEQNGKTARLVSKHMPRIPVVCCTQTPKIARQLSIFRSLHPIIPTTAPASWEAGVALAVQMAKDQGYVASGNTIVVIAAENQDHVAQSIRLVHVH
jgi:pyruvate kinase